jgi:hypothetical protein
LSGNKLKDGRIMFLFDKPEEMESLSKYCNKVIVDDPRIIQPFTDGTEKPISEMVKQTIELALDQAKIQNVVVEIRHLKLEGVIVIISTRICLSITRIYSISYSQKDNV